METLISLKSFHLFPSSAVTIPKLDTYVFVSSLPVISLLHILCLLDLFLNANKVNTVMLLDAAVTVFQH